MKQKIKYGLIGTVSLLMIFGGYVVLTPDELDNAYYCTTNSKVGIFESLSKTNVTGYWYEEGVRKQSTCTKGKWIPLLEYCESKGIKNCNKIEVTISEDVYTGKYWCTDTCDPIIN